MFSEKELVDLFGGWDNLHKAILKKIGSKVIVFRYSSDGVFLKFDAWKMDSSLIGDTSNLLKSYSIYNKVSHERFDTMIYIEKYNSDLNLIESNNDNLRIKFNRDGYGSAALSPTMLYVQIYKAYRESIQCVTDGHDSDIYSDILKLRNNPKAHGYMVELEDEEIARLKERMGDIGIKIFSLDYDADNVKVFSKDSENTSHKVLITW